jgi:uncharacterized membrane protein SpoIIM required for sporulation
VAIAALILLAGAGAGLALTLDDQERFYAFVDEDYASGRGPATSTEDLRDVLYHDERSSAETLGSFATFLFAHNARIGVMAFALGFLAGFPVFILVLIQGLVLGAFAALYHGRGLSLEFWGWLLPHGITELGAIVLCGAAGLVLAQHLVFPGRLRRLDALAAGGREAGQIVVGAVVMLFIAGMIEGIFRQTVHHTAIRYGVAVGTLLLWIAYFALAGRKPR